MAKDQAGRVVRSYKPDIDPVLLVCEFAGWLAETGHDLHELPNLAIEGVVRQFLRERENFVLGRTTDPATERKQ